MTLKDNIQQIKKELYINKTPEQNLQDGVNVKIGRTENNYNEAIKKNCMYILSRSNYKAMMAIDRYTKRKDKKSKDEQEDNYGFIETI